MGKSTSKPCHSGNPTLVVTALAADVFGHLRMRENQERLVGQSLNDGISDLIRPEHAIRMLRARTAGAQPSRIDCLRAENRDANALIVVSNRQIFGETDGSVFRRAVDGIPDLIEQACGRNGVEEISAPARDHSGQQGPGRIDVRHDVNRPASQPGFVGRRGYVIRCPAEISNAGIRTKQTDGADLVLGFLHQFADMVLVADVAMCGATANCLGDRLRALEVAVGNDDRPGSFALKAFAKSSPDSVSPPGNNDDLI